MIEGGHATSLGASCVESGANFALYSSVAEAVELCLFDEHGQTVGRHMLPPAMSPLIVAAAIGVAGALILSAAGDVDHDAIVAEAERLFGHLPRREVKAPEAAQFRGGERREVKQLEQAHFTLALEAPGYRSDDIYTAQIYATALGGGMSSRLFQEIREKRGLCYSIYAQAGAYSDTGMLTIYAGTSGAQIADQLIGGSCRVDAGCQRRGQARSRPRARSHCSSVGSSARVASILPLSMGISWSSREST